MLLVDFIVEFHVEKNDFTDIVLEWFWTDYGIDEEYCFEGSPQEFLKKYITDYDCLNGFTIFDVNELKVVKNGLRTKIYIEIVND